MERRKAITVMAGGLGATLVGGELLLTGCSPRNKEIGLFSEDGIHLLDEFGETILPATKDIPGAKAAKIGVFMAGIVTDCYSENEKELFLRGLQELAKARFLHLSREKREEILIGWEKEANDNTEEGNPHFFTPMKALVIWGYFTSEVGATKALRYNPIPGNYIGCVPYKVGDRAWAGS